ncbi:MFS multidrug transporter [Trametes versicolor FP-101664 SS1]|uniref:MFS multidrug transporter n=1 Tax=Trametes versicolor (strain FP-101664) TaxID=717944 RepID=UPI0004623151|nr:MFS multidrug transporter [Trametes versicolor FP-101664 SS1]EIW57943.1 MFS multidrug transporter [Trametes versicolor FP-101664 SS1]
MPDSPSTTSSTPTPPKPTSIPKGSAFWLSFLAIVVCNILSALDVTAVSTTLPTITHDLGGDNDFVWVGAAYGLASTAMLPFCGRLADVFGRRPVMMISVAFFFVGSALCGSAQNMNMLIAARTIQGVGGGGIINMSSIIVSDLVPLVERGAYQGIVVLAWAFAAAIGPIVGGSLAQKASWRWLFYINLPLAGIAFILVAIFLRVRTPEGSLRSKLARVDWVGNAIIVAGTTLALIALTWGGITYPWISVHVLTPLILGGALIVSFFLYETFVPREPTLPLDVIKNRTSLGGYIETFFHGIVSVAAIYYFPVYFQACLLSSPIGSSVKILPTAIVSSSFSLFSGIMIKKTNKYRPANWVGWTLAIVGFGLLTTLTADSSAGEWAGYQALQAAGSGTIWASTIFPILAPLPVTRAAPALAFYNFIRTFAQTWGVTISATILQNELKRNLPAAFVQDFPSGVEIAYAVIPQIPSLEEPLRSEVRAAFAQSMATIWKVLAGLSGAGFLASFLLREVPMQTYTDEKFGLQQAAPDAEPVRLEEARASVVTTGDEEDKKDADAVEMQAVNTPASLAA